jgi:single-stranded-DNA-specific exonuclease
VSTGDQWTVAEPDARAVDELVRELGMGEIAARCLVNRGHGTPEEARVFLDPKLRALDPPDRMADLERAVDRVVEALDRGERIGVFGDYDVDGVSSVALIISLLRQLGAGFTPLVADRFAGGFGLGAEAVERFDRDGCRLIVALDSGPGEPTASREAERLGIPIIVVDHHRVEGPRPDLLAYLNPQRPDCLFPDKSLAAVGLAFYFTAAIRTRLVETGRLERGAFDPRSLLDLVALGTVADVVPLEDNNRILVHHGLERLSRTDRPGLRALFRGARLRGNRIRTDHIAFQLAPRLNAAGRMSNAMDALELLICEDEREADRLTARLEQLTQERRSVEESVTEQACRQVEERRLDNRPVIVVSGDGWHRGVLGIVAARLTEQFGKPTFVLGFDGEVGVGSARAQGQLNLYESLVAAAPHLVRYGGHRDAAGFTVDRSALDELYGALDDFASRSTDLTQRRGVVCDARLRPDDANQQLLCELDRLAPFGNCNPEPVFEVNELRVIDSRVVGAGHLKLELIVPGGSISAFGPRMGRDGARVPPVIRVAATLSPDEWKGDGSPELRLQAPPVEV